MERALYLDAGFGISGDMFIAALLDLGANKKIMLRALDSLCIHGYEIKISRVEKAGFDACDFLVVLDERYENHDHDMEYLHGKSGKHIIEKNRQPERERRNIDAVGRIIEKADMTEKAKRLAMKIFGILAQAEAKAHGVAIDEVYFHELGAVDSIVDVVAAAVCYDNLKIDRTFIPRLVDGTGTIRCRHGLLPVPVPAVKNIDEAHDLRLKISDVEGELVTPTGAAIAAAIRTDLELPTGYAVRKIGLGAGKRQYKCPGILKAYLLELNEDDKF